MRIFKCDFCGRNEEQRTSALPEDWARIEVKLKTGGEYLFKLDACPGCRIYPKHFATQERLVQLLIAVKNQGASA